MKKALLALFFLLSSLFVFKVPAFAQTASTQSANTTQSSQYLAPNTNPDVPQNLHTWTQNAMLEVFSATICQLAGIDVINHNQECLGVDSKTGKIGYVKSGGGLIGITALVIGSTYTPPIHTGDYIGYLSQNFGLAKGAYAQAQGFGFSALNPLIPIWSIFRNLAYVFLIVVFLIIGVAIMLRVKIDPRTVMTIQNQIPKIIIALILITFSFAISGLLIDLMYLFIFIIFGLFSDLLKVAGSNVYLLNPTSIQGKSVIEAIGAGGSNVVTTFGIPHNIALGAKDVLKNILGIDQGQFGAFGSLAQTLGAIFGVVDWSNFSLGNYLTNILTFGISLHIASLIPCATGSIPVLGGVGCDVQTGIETAGLFPLIRFFFTDVVPYMIVYLIVFIAILYALFRTLFMLIMSYVLFLIDVIFAPLWILAGLLPGNNSFGFSAWIKDVVANLAVFPTIYLMVILSYVLTNAFKSNPGFTPPLIGNPLAGSFLSAIIGLGVLLLMPQAATMIKAAIKAPSLPTQGLAGPLRTGVSVGSAMGGFMVGRMYRRDPRTGELHGPIGSAINRRSTNPIIRFIFGIREPITGPAGPGGPAGTGPFGGGPIPPGAGGGGAGGGTPPPTP